MEFWEIFHRCFILKIVFLGGSGIAQRLRVIVVLPEDMNLNPSTIIGHLIDTCNSTFLGPDALFWPSYEYAYMCAYIHADTHINKNKINI